MYNNYINFIQTIIANDDTIKTVPFKRTSEYMYVLEHVSCEHGTEYLNRINVEFPFVTFNNLLYYTNLNDKYGSPHKFYFTLIGTENTLYCSPTSLRYIYHSLLILKDVKKKNNNTIVEVGGGYGGLYLAINIFAPLMGVNLEKYSIVDLPEVTELIKKYVELHKNEMLCPLDVYPSNTIITSNTADIIGTDYFFVSNYCFTEIEEKYRNIYVDKLVKPSSHGFIIWQTCCIALIETYDILNKNTSYEEEKPQTTDLMRKNFFVRW